MANWKSDVAGFKVDNASASLTDISDYVNNVDVDGGQEFLDDTGLSDTRENTLAGLGTAARVTVNGFINSTTFAIFGPLINGTSLTKTIEVKYTTGSYHTGEAYPENVRLGLPVKRQQTFSVDFMAEDGLTKTSVAAS